ncbi:PPDK_N domain-containing protein, partial [Nephila pilipes]
MKELELSPYKIQVTQPLKEDHTQRRSEFAQLMLEKLQTGEIDVKKIWFSDEAYFTLDGHLNKQNYRYWGRERLEITVVRSLHPKKFLVWCATSSHGVFGPIFIDGTLSAANYRKFLDEEFIPFLHGHDLVQGHWFMQDGARPHRTADVFEVLNEHFSDRIIGLDYPSHFQGGIEWPPYSPDLNPCDYYLSGYLKSKVLQTSPTNLPELKTAITTAVDTIDSEACSRIERFYKSSRDIEWGILNDEIYILQSRPVTNASSETDFEIKHEFDAPLRCEHEYFTVANVGEVMPGATSPLGIEVLTKSFSNVLKRQAFEKGIVDNLFQSKYFLTGILPFYNNMMITVAEMLIRYGLNTPRSKGFMISVFGRLLDDPDLLEYAGSKVQGEFKSSLISDLRYYKDLFFFDYGIEKAKQRFDNYHYDFLKPKTAKEAFKAILNSCSDFDEAVLYHMECSENSSNWNMYMFTTLCEAKGNFDNDVYSDFASLLATSSDVESANVPQAMQDVADQIVKDIGKEKFSSLSEEDAEKWLQTSTSLAGYKFRQFIKRHGHRCLREFDVKSITWGMDPKLLVKLLQNLAGTSKESSKKEDSIDAIFSELNVPLSFMSKCYLRFVLPQCRRGVRRREFSK